MMLDAVAFQNGLHVFLGNSTKSLHTISRYLSHHFYQIITGLFSSASDRSSQCLHTIIELITVLGVHQIIVEVVDSRSDSQY